MEIELRVWRKKGVEIKNWSWEDRSKESITRDELWTAVDIIKRKWKREYWKYKDSLEIYPFLKSENLI